jgi:hypothetical protein
MLSIRSGIHRPSPRTITAIENPNKITTSLNISVVITSCAYWGSKPLKFQHPAESPEPVCRNASIGYTHPPAVMP